MFHIGEKQTLIVTKEAKQGYYLKSTQPAENPKSLPLQDRKLTEILLPGNQVHQKLHAGDEIEVFIYRDSEDRLIATTKEPYLTLGQVKMLTVREVSHVGAFLDWGLEKDLLLPFHEQLYKVEQGDEVLVALYLDKSSRLCATMNVYEYLSTDAPYETDEQVEGIVCNTIEQFGVFVAVDGKYSGMIPTQEIHRSLKPGTKITARITRIRPDGKLNLSLQKKAFEQMDDDSALIYHRLEENGGTLPFHDKTDPEIIREEFQLSKAAFKRAIGRLMKEGKIRISESGICFPELYTDPSIPAKTSRPSSSRKDRPDKGDFKTKTSDSTSFRKERPNKGDSKANTSDSVSFRKDKPNKADFKTKTSDSISFRKDKPNKSDWKAKTTVRTDFKKENSNNRPASKEPKFKW